MTQTDASVSSPLLNKTMTTVYIVRHAEKNGAGADPKLSAAGVKRAKTLAYMLKQDKMEAVFVTQYQRSRQTGEPTALDSDVPLLEYDEPTALADLIIANYSGRRVLVVAHSNTVQVIAARLIASLAIAAANILEHQYDRFFVVHRIGARGYLDRLSYGVATP